MDFYQILNMEAMEIDQTVDVPDTPDRSTSWHVIRGDHVGDSGLVDEKCMNELRGRGRPAAENGNGRRLVIRPPKHSSSDDEFKNCSNSFVLSQPKKFCASQSASLFRRASTDRNLDQERRHPDGVKKMDKGKAICTKIPSKSSFQGDVTVLDLTEENGEFQTLKTAFPADNATEEMRGQKPSSGNSSFHCTMDSPMTRGYEFKGKEKIDNYLSKGPGLGLIRGKKVDLSGDSQHQKEKRLSLPIHPSPTPRVNAQKRLVRNGCISPHNIATRAKQSAEQNGDGSKNVAQDNTDCAVSSNTPSLVDISDVISEEKSHNRVKGKGALVHTSTPGLHDASIHPLSSNSMINAKDANATNHATRNAFGSSGGLAGWRTTHNHLRNNQQPIPDVLRQSNNRVERSETPCQSNWVLCGRPENHAGQAASVIVSEPDRVTGPHPTTKTLNKRQRKHGLTLNNHEEGANSVSCDSEVIFLHSSGESSNSRSQVQQPWGMLDTEVVELSPEARHPIVQGVDGTNNGGSDSRARQVEADEILALELQEQLYHEELAVGGGEMDEHLAWDLQHQEEVIPPPVGSHPIPHPRVSSTHAIRHPRSRSYQNPSTRRRTQTQVPISNRMARRSRILSQSPRPRVPTTGRSVRFPLHMDLDMRLDILEALEAAVGDISDIGMDDDISQVQRDFNENDYEMLLALDENNHRHAGTSASQINSLPQSTVQTETIEEACAICLETPTMGETIRHLPCLHKFHKDCIDPWLQRKTSCPVCKSSVT